MTIKEAVIFTGKSESTLYRYIRKGKIAANQMTVNDNQVTIIEKAELLRVFPMGNSQVTITDNQDDRQVTITDNQVTMDKIKDAINQAITEKQSQIMKPIEEQALYRLGILENEVKHLHAEKEVLRQENEDLKNSMKALPIDLKKRDDTILQLQEEMDILPGRPSEVKEILLQNADNLKALQKELELQEVKLKAEYEEKLKQAIEQSEKEKTIIADRWKKELELSKRPWWKLW